AGQRLSVSRGKPSGGAVRSYDFSSGSAAHSGCIDLPSGSAVFTAWNAFQPTSASFEMVFEPVLPFDPDSPRLKLSLNIEVCVDDFEPSIFGRIAKTRDKS